MKKFSIVTGLAMVLALSVSAQTLPSYTTLTATGTTTATVWFASSPLQQVRVVGAVVTSDKAGANLTFRSGVTPLTIAYTNPASTWIGVSSTNGFTIGDFVIVETMSGLWTNAQITAFTAATNIICADKVMATVPGDQVYKMGTATRLPVGAATISYQGDALFVGNKGRPVWVTLDGTSACTLNAITGRYE